MMQVHQGTSPNSTGVAKRLEFRRTLTFEEIAERLGVSLSTVRADMRFARAWLSAALGGEAGSES